jgi:hypothetical protein
MVDSRLAGRLDKRPFEQQSPSRGMIRAILTRAWNDPTPLRRLIGVCARRLGLLSYKTTADLFLAHRAHYAYCALKAAELASRLGVERISVVELGVGRGAGLANLEHHASEVEKATGIRIDVYGFDLGSGLPPHSDVRDLPHFWKQGFYRMDESAVRAGLSKAELILGDVSRTIPNFLSAIENTAPIGFVAFDLDFYSSTMAALAIFEAASRTRLPRVFIYFDDIVLDEIALVTEHVGELAAIRNFNDGHDALKIGQAVFLKRKPLCTFAEQIYVLHDFGHPQYTHFIAHPAPQ